MSPNIFIYGHLVKTQWLVADMIAIGSPDRANCAVLGVILAGRVLANPGRFVVEEPLCGAGAPS